MQSWIHCGGEPSKSKKLTALLFAHLHGESWAAESVFLSQLPLYRVVAAVSPECFALDLVCPPCVLRCHQDQPFLHGVAPVPQVQGIPLCILFSSPPAFCLHPFYSSSGIEARKHNKGRRTGAKGEGRVHHGQCTMVRRRCRPQIFCGRYWR